MLTCRESEWHTIKIIPKIALGDNRHSDVKPTFMKTLSLWLKRLLQVQKLPRKIKIVCVGDKASLRLGME